LWQEPSREAAPRPILSALDEAGSQRVPFDVAAGSHQLRRGLDVKGLESTLIDGTLADGVAMMMPSHCVGNCYPVHQLGQPRGVDGTHHQVPVVGHHTVGNQSSRVSFEALAEHLQEGAVIIRPPEQRRFPDAPVDDVKVRFTVTASTSPRHRWASSHSKRDAHSAAPAARIETCPRISVICGKEI
jgi:hypothetical protein